MEELSKAKAGTGMETGAESKMERRPWGYYVVTYSSAGYQTKLLHVDIHQQLSLQSHNYRSEHWVVVSGRAKVILDDREYILNVGESIDIPVACKHSLQNPFDMELEVVEIQMGALISEDDIIRYSDIYGRG